MIHTITLNITDVTDIEKHYPGLMKATVEWFKIYKIPDGKPENQFAFNGEAKSREFALHIVDEVHQHWENLIKREAPAGGIAWFVNSFMFHSKEEIHWDMKFFLKVNLLAALMYLSRVVPSKLAQSLLKRY